MFKGKAYRKRIRNQIGWAVSIVAAIMLPICLWLLEPAAIGEPSSWKDMLTIVAKIGAFMGLASFAWSLVLGARLQLVDKLFSGLDKVYVAHHIFGGFAFLAILAHAIAITVVVSYTAGLEALMLWVPGVNMVVTWGVIAFGGLVVFLVLTVFIKLKHETFIRLHRLLGIFLVPAALHAFLAGGHMAENSALRRYLLVLTLAGVVAYLYHSVFGAWLIKRYPHLVVAVNNLGEGVVEVVLKPTWRPLNHEAGQFGYLSIRDQAVNQEPHPFSFSSSKFERNTAFVIKDFGDYTGKIGRVQPGAKAFVEGPFGGFGYREVRNRRQIWVAGGIGVTPFLSMGRSFGSYLRYDIDFFYCTKNVEQALFLEEFRSLARKHDGFKLHHVCEECDGFLTAEKVAKVCDIAGADILVCGPLPMETGLREQFLAAGVPEWRLHNEQFSF